MKRALENRLGVVLGGGLTLVFLIGVFQCQTISRLVDTDRRSALSHEALTELAMTRSRLEEGEAEAGAYTVTGQQAFLDSSQSAALRVSASLHRLRGLWTDDPRQRTGLDGIEPLLVSDFARQHEAELALRTARIPRARPPVAAAEAGGKTREDWRPLLRGMEEKERGRLAERSAGARVAAWEAILSTTVGSGLALWLIILTGLVLRHYVAQRRRADLGGSLASQLLEGMAEGVWLSDESGLILYANPACEAMLGYMAGELPGKNVTVLIDCRRQNDLVVEQIRQRLESHAVWKGELNGHRKDGSPFSWYARISGLDVYGKLHWVGVQDERAAGWV